MHLLTSVQDLEGRIGKASDLIHLKTIDHLDSSAREWIAASPMAVTGIGASAGLSVGLVGGRPGWASADETTLRIPLAYYDGVAVAPGASFGSFFMVPSVNELVRVNGKVAAVTESEAVIAVEECYFHCGKALIRSQFWQAEPAELTGDDPLRFAEASRFLALGTVDGSGHADVSPKGDLIGMMARLDGETLWFSDRPGNKRIDSFRNIVTQPRVGAALIVPGVVKVMRVTGVASITDDEAVCSRFAVQNNIPGLAIGICCDTIELSDSPTLARAGLWPAPAKPAHIDGVKIGIAHMKLAKGMKARLASAAMAIPGLMQHELEKNYKKQLF